MGFDERPQAVWWRKALFQVHLWIGAFLGLYVIAISISGSVLVFERNILDDAPRLGQDHICGQMTYGQTAALALKAHPGSSLNNIDMRSANRRVVGVGLEQDGENRIVYVDSFSARIVGDEILQRKHALVEFLESLHNELAAGAVGAVMNGIGGALLFAMSATGIVLWWPGRRNWKRALKVKWNARWARLNWDLHSAFGFWCLLFVAMWGLSGTYFIFPQPFIRCFALFSSMSHLHELPSEWQPSQSILPVDAYIRKATRMYPHDKLAYLYMDVYRPHGRVQVFLSRDPTVPLSLLEDVVVFQPSTGDVLSDLTSSSWTSGERLSMSIYSVHFGDFGGMPWKVAWAILGLVPVLLTVTGYLMWWNRVLKKKWAKLRVSRPVVDEGAVLLR